MALANFTAGRVRRTHVTELGVDLVSTLFSSSVSTGSQTMATAFETGPLTSPGRDHDLQLIFASQFYATQVSGRGC